MKFTAMVILVVVECPWAANAAADRASRVAVCMSTGAATPTYAAQANASEIFHRAGVTIDWHTMATFPASPDVIRISFLERTPKTERPSALAYALPYEGTHIVVYYDRVREHVRSDQLPQLLACVLVHEITHILQMITRHSESGIMKAHWDVKDDFDMRTDALGFTEEDKELLRMGLDRRLPGRDSALVAIR